MANEQYRVILNNGTRIVQEQMNQAAAEGFKAFAVDNQSFIYMKREVDELTAPPIIAAPAPQMTIVDTTQVRSTGLTESELALYTMLQGDGQIAGLVYNYPSELVSSIYHLVQRLLMQVQSPPTPTITRLRDEASDMAAENVRLLGRLSECQRALAVRDQTLSDMMAIDAAAAPGLTAQELSWVDGARVNWNTATPSVHDTDNLLRIIQRITGITA